MKNILNALYRTRLLTLIMPTTVSCLKKELEDCQSVLDLGCGADSPLQNCKNIKYSVGVESFKLYLEKSKKKKIHTKYLNTRIEDLKLSPKSFDAVILIEVIEHLPKRTGLTILRKAEKWAKKKVVVTTPNGFISQKEIDNNPLQKHLSGWTVQEMKKKAFNCKGLAGLKFLRVERPHDTAESDLTSSIRFWPKIFWFIIASLSQTITYHFPSIAFELFCVKRLKNTRTK